MKINTFKHSFYTKSNAFLFKSFLFSFLMLGFFACEKDVVSTPIQISDGEISTRTDDDDCRCFMRVNSVSNSDQVPSDVWGFGDNTPVNPSPTFIGVSDDTWALPPLFREDVPFPTNFEELGGPIPGVHEFVLNYNVLNLRDLPVDPADDFTVNFTIECFTSDGEGGLNLATSVTHEVVWSNADRYGAQNNSHPSSAFFNIEFGCQHLINSTIDYHEPCPNFPDC